MSKRELRSNGRKIVEASALQLKAQQEGIGAICDVLLDGSQSTYLHIYRQSDAPQRLLQARNAFLATSFPAMPLRPWGWWELRW